MSAVNAIFACLTISIPLVAMAWAMKPRHCPNCGHSVAPDPDFMRMSEER
jgi:hypothetical protein